MTDFSTKVIRWQKKHGRHDLPWQNTRNAYRIWLSEIMLQQTQVATVIPYYRRFLRRFPGIKALAAAPLDDVLAAWSGLGYYSRARNLHRAAQDRCAQHRGVSRATLRRCSHCPASAAPPPRRSACSRSATATRSSTATSSGSSRAASASPVTPATPELRPALWHKAGQLLPLRNIEPYTQGLMDLGAAVCTRGKPRCDVVRWRADCIARRARDYRRIADAAPAQAFAAAAHAHVGAAACRAGAAREARDHRYLGRLVEPAGGCGERGRHCPVRAALRCRVATSVALPTVAHGFTHFKLDIEPQRLGVARVAPRAAAPGVMWLPLEEALGAAIPAPVRRILAALAAEKA